jgi:enoyl-CoA hydratase/carnithine racemase
MTRVTINEEVRDGVLVLTLNRPARRNAFNEQQYDEVRVALTDAAANDEIRVVVITGAPGAFSAGQDIDEMGRGGAFTPFVDQLATFDKPLLAAVNGVAVGIGLTMLLHCDIVYIAESARLRAPFVTLGLVCEAGSSLLLSMVVGPQRAAEVLFTGRWITAAEAVEWGLAARVVPDSELLPAILANAREIASQPLAAVRGIKQLLLATRADALRAARAREDVTQLRQLGSPENLAAIRAFQAKRRPSAATGQ